MLLKRLHKLQVHQFRCCVSYISRSLQEMWKRRFIENDVENPFGSVKELAKYATKNLSKEKDAESIFNSLCNRRLNREPLQYLIEEWDFRSMTLIIKHPVFIPRPETEGLIDIVKPHLKENAKFIEMGCGSGAISLALLNELTTVQCVALDSFHEAVNLTQKNAEKLKLANRINVFHRALDELKLSDVGGEKFDMLVSNPPYIPHEQLAFLQEEVKNYEHHDALDGGRDGLDVIRCILQIAPNFVTIGGYVWLEVDVSHPPLIQELVYVKPSLGLKFVSTFNDCYNRPRFCQLQLLAI